jgi:hypothetical protein
MKSNLIDKTQNSSPVVFHQGQLQNTNNTYDSSCSYPEIETKGEQQPRRFNDVIWALLFYAYIGTLIAVTVQFLPVLIDQMGGIQNNYNGVAQGDDAVAYDNSNNYMKNADDYYRRLSLSEFHQRSSLASLAVGAVTRALVQATSLAGLQLSPTDFQERSLQDQETGDAKGLSLLVGLTVVGAFFLSILSLTLMIRYAEGLIKMSLFFNICIGLVTSITGFVSGSTEAGVMGLIIFALAVCYTWAIWSRIPFAAANLVTASTAIQANMGVTVFAFGAIVLNGLWMVFWSVSAYSTLFVLGGCDIDGTCTNEIPAVYSFLFLLSLYWTAQVIKNVVHVTVAGTVGTWWWAPLEANSCCSSAVTDSHKRAISYSFGSICLGSLLVAIIQTLKSLAESARQNDDGILRCIADCILGCLETIMEIFNEWAFVYVGLYGYNFVEAAKNVMTLFKARGWTAIITDYMLDRVLLMISFGNGLLSGGIAAGISYMLQLNLEGIAFGVGFLVGLILTSVILSVVGSGVNTVIVCYAEDPATFEINHFDLSMRMRSSWREAFPNDFRY